MLKVLRNSSGSVGMLAILAMLFVGIIGGAYVTLSASNVTASARTRDDIAAQYLAEAGAQWAIAQLTANAKYATVGYTSPTKNAGTPTAGVYKVKITQNPDNTITIESIGVVNKSISRTVSLQARPGSGSNGINNGTVSGSVLGKYDIFSQNGFWIYGNSSPHPIISDIGTNAASKAIHINTPNHSGKLYVSHDFTDYYYPSAPSGWYVKLSSETEVGTLTVNVPAMPAFPSTTSSILLPTTSGNQFWNKNYSLTDSSYYYNTAYLLNGTSKLQAPAGHAVTIIINGDLKLDTSAVLEGDDITIYVTGNFEMANDSLIKPISANHKSQLKIYVQGTVKLTNYVSIYSDTVFIQSGSTSSSAIVLDNSASINNNNAMNSVVNNTTNTTDKTIFSTDYLKDACTTLYSNNGGVYFTNQASIEGKAGVVVAQSTINLDNQVQAPSTLFIASNTGAESYVTGSSGAVWWPKYIAYSPVSIAGIYTNGKIKVDGSPIFNKARRADALNFLMSGTGGSSLEITSWSNKSQQ